ncbi:hypothetical protein HPB49_013000 [Dermacentor silvarum]|uniref:Uncharacterized protein n=1 Tax=Dermacentor silvarum TaxID=543639 RepID=A0ACB8C9G3_DERSI|nr:hypothetical protein HPB49_013000 [Dermacentor silvarum]
MGSEANFLSGGFSVTVGDANKSICSPRFSPDGNTLVYLQSEVGGPHFQACQLVKCCWETKQTLIIIDRINTPIGNEFPGLYLNALPQNCFIGDGNTVVLSTCWHSKWASALNIFFVEVIINLTYGSITKLSKDETVGCWQVLTVKENFIVACLSALNSTPHVLYPILFVKCGFAVLLVNYRGSKGFGEDNLRSLLGKIGQQDVFDVQCAAEVAAQRDEINPDKMIIFGGSHGGFLACHAIGQFPSFYRASMDATDIPDWRCVESGVIPDYSPTCVPEPKQLEHMWNKSPMKFVKNVHVPTLVILGKNDLRVPVTQGMKFYKTLLAQGVSSQMYMYDDNHALSKVNVEADMFVNTVLWFKKFIN